MKISDNTTTTTKDKIYFVFSYFGSHSESLKFDILKILKNHCGNIDFQVILYNGFRIRNLFSFKDCLPKSMRANVIYEFSCTSSSTPVTYIGSTKKHLYERVAQHANRSPRTGKLLNSECHSNIFDHMGTCTCEVKLDDFKILGNESNFLISPGTAMG